MYPFAANEFSSQIMRVQVIKNKAMIFELHNPHVTDIFQEMRKRK